MHRGLSGSVPGQFYHYDRTRTGSTFSRGAGDSPRRELAVRYCCRGCRAVQTARRAAATEGDRRHRRPRSTPQEHAVTTAHGPVTCGCRRGTPRRRIVYATVLHRRRPRGKNHQIPEQLSCGDQRLSSPASAARLAKIRVVDLVGELLRPSRTTKAIPGDGDGVEVGHSGASAPDPVGSTSRARSVLWSTPVREASRSAMGRGPRPANGL